MLWYGIGILYDRYGSYDYAQEAFSQVMQIQPDFDKANEIYFRLGIIYKQQTKFSSSLEVSFPTTRPQHSTNRDRSVSSTSLPRHHLLYHKMIFGSKSATSTSSKKSSKPLRMLTTECSRTRRLTPRFSSSLGGSITSRTILMSNKNAPFSILKSRSEQVR